jgi:hypothetical protein
MGYLDELRAFVSDTAPDEVLTKPTKGGSVSFVGRPPRRITEECAKALLSDWHRQLTVLDVYEPPEGFDQRRWGTLVDDCCWLYATHASRLVRDGWSAADLFAVIPSQRGWGGLADRLLGARNVLFDDASKAHWTRAGVKFSTSRGVGEALRGSDARLVWYLTSTTAPALQPDPV